MQSFVSAIAIAIIIYLAIILGGVFVKTEYPEAISLYYNIVLCPILTAAMLYLLNSFDKLVADSIDDEETP